MVRPVPVLVSVAAVVLTGVAAQGPPAAPTEAARQRGAPTVSLSFVRGPSVFMVSADGSRVSRVLRGTGTDLGAPGELWYFDPAWSRDGRLLAVTVEEATESHGYDDVVVFRQGKKWLTLPGGESSISGNPSWAPDGKRLVLVGYQSESGGGLYVQGVGSKINIELTNEWANADDAPAWSPDGSKIAFARTQAGRASLYLIRPNGRNLAQLTKISARNPSWSPDGKRLVFDDGRRIAVVNADGTRLRFLTHPSGVDAEPAWSPDGRTIAFTRYKSANSQARDIWLMTPTGATQRLFVKNASQPAWKPNPR